MLPPLIAWADGGALPPRHLPDGAATLWRPPSGSRRPTSSWSAARRRGPADHLRGVLGRLGAAVLVDGVAVRPGHPQALARLPGGRLVVGLPGNPFAALAAALTLLTPVLRALNGRPEPEGELSTLAGPVRGHPRDTRLVPVWRSARGAIPVGHDQPRIPARSGDGRRPGGRSPGLGGRAGRAADPPGLVTSSKSCNPPERYGHPRSPGVTIILIRYAVWRRRNSERSDRTSLRGRP